MFKGEGPVSDFSGSARGGGHDVDEDLSSLFFSTFSLEIADTKEKQEKAFYLRWLSYCVENDLQFPDADYREADKYDHDEYDEQGCVIHPRQSTHALLRANETGLYVGTVRIIREGLHELPATAACQDRFLDQFRSRGVYNEPVAEISRFSLPHGVMRAAGINNKENRDLALCGLMAAVFCMCKKTGVSVAIGAQEDVLSKKIKRLGIDFDWQGELFDYHGPRRPFIMSEDKVIESLRRTPPVYRLFMTARDRFDITIDESVKRGNSELAVLKEQAKKYRPG